MTDWLSVLAKFVLSPMRKSMLERVAADPMETAPRSHAAQTQAT